MKPRKVITDEQMDRAILLLQRNNQLRNRQLLAAGYTTEQIDALEAKANNGPIELDDVIELFGTHYRVLGFKPDGIVILAKITNDRQWRP